MIVCLSACLSVCDCTITTQQEVLKFWGKKRIIFWIQKKKKKKFEVSEVPFCNNLWFVVEITPKLLYRSF